MIAINHTLISEDIFDKKFVCDLNACKGECCVSGDSGAPLDKKELKILRSALLSKLIWMGRLIGKNQYLVIYIQYV